MGKFGPLRAAIGYSAIVLENSMDYPIIFEINDKSRIMPLADGRLANRTLNFQGGAPGSPHRSLAHSGARNVCLVAICLGSHRYADLLCNRRCGREKGQDGRQSQYAEQDSVFFH